MREGEKENKSTMDHFLDMVNKNGYLEFTRRDMEWGDTLVVSKGEFLEELGDEQ